MLEVVALTWRLAAEVKAPTRPSGPSFSLLYRGGPACPTRANFEAAILARAPGSRSVAEGQEADVRFDAEPATRASEKGRLRVALEDGTSQDREIDADDCAEAVQSMAIIAAMVLEAQPAPEPTPEVPEPEQPPPVLDLKAETRLPSTIPPRAPQPSRPTWLRLGASGVAEGAAAPSPAWGGALHAELGSRSRRVLAPSIRVSALYARAATVETSAGDARFQLALGRAHLCWLRWGSSSAEVRWCALFEAGVLAAQGLNALKQRRQTMPWIGVGLGAVYEQRLDSRWSLELNASLRGLPVHDEFVFAPGTRVHQVPVVTWDFGLALSYRVW